MQAPTSFNLWQLTEDYLETAPNPEAMEEKTESLGQGLAGLGGRSLLGLNIPAQWSGIEVSPGDYFGFLERLTRYSGTLAFTQIQHQTAGSFIAGGENESLKRDYLPKMRSGERLIGVSYAHVSRDKPTLEATNVDGGYRLSGYLPWITGWNLFQEAVIAARLPDGHILFALIPLVSSVRGDLRFSPPMALAAMASTNTVSAQCDRYFIADRQVVAIRSPDWIANKDRNSVLDPTFPLLGLARASLDLVEKASQKQTEIVPHSVALSDRLEDCRQQIYRAKEQQHLSLEQEVQLRAQAIALTHECTLAAILVSRGRANQTDHPGQRIYREALVLSVIRHTNAVMEATLQYLVSSKP
ncbi:acyl-CoA/acyl-ACP dehydrogenase [Roseofilum sp. BLCC_M91]|uniref:Acyl-CoA/acyl-ACP dehydrogenase n=1 Tax=Roseofilum halophilum BLCC-M91 TaxID=3022259 RepID=A0ABT7BML8_9CYAN|nr:acyl-CoA dehydrogenase family protein [Roseofilum halophilum]MDJ1180007.1 acyl-CoA/acyl-ACP dehydrogenase [Roseofilum halophilum BLCC-M91]